MDYVVRTINAIMRGDRPQHEKQEHVEEGHQEGGRGQQQQQQDPQEPGEQHEHEQERVQERGREHGAEEAVAHAGQGAGQPAAAAGAAAAGGASAAICRGAEGAFPFPRLFLVSTYVIGKERILLAVRGRALEVEGTGCIGAQRGETGLWGPCASTGKPSDLRSRRSAHDNLSICFAWQAPHHASMHVRLPPDFAA